jgi:hypothetical protein
MGLKALAENGHKFQNLQKVWLENNQITDVGLQQVKQQYKLKFSIYK